MEAWRRVFRDGFLPSLPREGLEALKKALESDDPRLMQGGTTQPPPLQCVQDWPVEAACLIGYCGWQGGGMETVADVEEFFAKACFEADERLGEPAACRWLLNWYDETPRDEMRRLLLAEVSRALAGTPEGQLPVQEVPAVVLRLRQPQGPEGRPGQPDGHL